MNILQCQLAEGLACYVRTGGMYIRIVLSME